MKHRVVLVLALASGCITTLGPDPGPEPGAPLGPATLRLAPIEEVLTGSWAQTPDVGGFKADLAAALARAPRGERFATTSGNLALEIVLTSDHADDGPRLVGLGALSLVTVGIIPLHYRSEWRVDCRATIKSAGGAALHEIALQETGVYDVWALPLTMFSLLGAGIAGDSDWVEIRRRTAESLATRLVTAIDAEHEALARWKAEGLAEPAVRPTAPIEPGPAVPPPNAPNVAPNGFALVVGISRYQHAGMNGLGNLQYADGDAKDVARALEGLGWSHSHVKLLTDEQATRREVQIALESWLTKAGKDDVVLLFWAGHAFPSPEDPEKIYFVCHDTDVAIPATGYRMDHVTHALAELRCRNVVVLADTCHAGKLLARGARDVAALPYVEMLRREQKVPRGWIIMVGADTDRSAIEHSTWSHGAFTHCLLQGMGGGADGHENAGEKDGLVTMGELRSFLLTEMPEQSQRVLGVAKHPLVTTSTGDPDIWRLALRLR